MDVSHVARSTVQTTVSTLVASDDDKHDLHNINCGRKVVVFKLRGAVRFPGAERLTRALAYELGKPDPSDPGSGCHANACAIVFSFREVFSLNFIARRLIHENITRLLGERRVLAIIDPTGVLEWDRTKAKGDRHPKVVDNDTEARDYIGGTGCQAVSEDPEW